MAKALQRAEKALTRRATLPRGMKVASFANNEYVGEPAGWLMPKVCAVVANSGSQTSKW